MRRAIRWLWRQWRRVALLGVLATLGVLGAMAASASLPAFAEQTALSSVRQASPTLRDDTPTPQEQARAHERAARARMLYLVSLLYEGALLFAFIGLGGTRWLAHLVTRIGPRWVLGLAAVLGILTVASTLLTLPLDYYSSYLFAHQYGLSNQTPLQWLRDYLVEGGVGIVIGFPLAVLGYALLRRFPRTWWLWLSAASIPVSIVLMLITPVFITPLFNKFTPLPDGPLKHDILEMAHQQGIHAEDVYEMNGSRQSNAVNAYVIGFGPTLRIVLYDTLVKEFTPQEVQFVLAHEMGHYVLGHIYQGILFSVLGTFIGAYLFALVAQRVLVRYHDFLGVATLGNPASYPIIMALGMVFSLIALPIGNAFSRHLEWQADRFAVRIYPHPAAGIAAFHKLGRLNVAEENPPRWAEVLFGSHPSLAERINALEHPGACPTAPP
ncbi:MAG TPA: M48 family metallopeptidase [Armatimonadota bacterium]|jgi:STE24 endopeptidase